jgi:hypothetical protein
MSLLEGTMLTRPGAKPGPAWMRNRSAALADRERE